MMNIELLKVFNDEDRRISSGLAILIKNETKNKCLIVSKEF